MDSGRERPRRPFPAALVVPVALALLPPTASGAPGAGCAYDTMLSADGTTIHVTVPPKEACSIGTYTVTIAKKGTKPQVVKLKRDGTITNVFFEDVTGDGSRELIVFASSAGSGAYGRLDIWEWTRDRWKAGIVSDLSEEQRTGYRGHDAFTAAAGVLRRRFPVYVTGDANWSPSGGTAAFRWDPKKNVWIRE